LVTAEKVPQVELSICSVATGQGKRTGQEFQSAIMETQV
jgi:hypothetical protein